MNTVTLSIGEVARAAGLATSAIRFYERQGLLPRPARSSGRRRYTEAVYDRLALLAFARQSGFKLREIRILFHGSREGAPVSARWQILATMKLAELNEQLQRIELMKTLLERALSCRCVNPDECGRRIRIRQAGIERAN